MLALEHLLTLRRLFSDHLADLLRIHRLIIVILSILALIGLALSLDYLIVGRVLLVICIHFFLKLVSTSLLAKA